MRSENQPDAALGDTQAFMNGLQRTIDIHHGDDCGNAYVYI